MAKHEPDLLEWTVAEAPAETETWPAPMAPLPVAPRPTLAPRWALPRRAWLMLAGLALTAVLAATLVLPWLEGYRVRRAVEQVITLETEAARAGDWEALRALYDADERAWVYNEIEALKVGGQPMGLQNFSAFPAEPGGTLRWVQPLAPALAQAEIERTFRLAEGATATLAVTQFYRYAEGAWVHTPPPDDWWGETRQWQGTRVDLAYRAADAAYAAELGPYLDGLAAQACARWQCADDVRVPVEVVSAIGGTNLGSSGYSRIDSLVFSLLASGARPGGTEALPVPSPYIAGHARDEATLSLMRRPSALRVLLRLAMQAHGPAQADPGSLFFYALVARDLARLGLEAPALSQRRVANPLYGADQLWAMSSRGYTADAALTEALVILNHLLEGQPPETEAVLLRTIRDARDPITWLAAGLDLSPAEVRTRLIAALDPPVPLAASGPAAAELVMQCETGPWLATRDGQAWPLLAGSHANPWTWPVSWSPDGQRLAVVIAGRAAVVDVAAGTATWLPRPMAEFGTPLQWVSDTVVAYEVVTAAGAPANMYAPANLGLHFYDAADPARQFAPLPEVTSYVLSPDRTRAVAWRSGLQPALVIIPALGGEPVRIGGGSQPQWSPDSTQIAFVNQDVSGGRWSLRLADANTGEYRTLLAADNPRLLALGVEAEVAWVWFTWSPRGDELAIYLQAHNAGRRSGWLGLLAVDGSGFRPLRAPEPGLTPMGGGATFSGDGRTLAVPLWSSTWEGRTALYDVDAAAWLHTFPAGTSAHWSQPGSSLILADESGTYMVGEPLNPAAPRQPLAGRPCFGVQWRPD